ncbi:hypothetical protein [Flavobacterium sp.]|uniref:hypothetical protein n=1 Tax=Flavobacterium sp. TaxID=239 RepID=UPI00286DD07F|nr:hypothetical protein [Flavobacterium sp.]
MKKLEDFKGSLFTKEAMRKTVGGRVAAMTKTDCDGTTTGCGSEMRLDCGDSSEID